MTKHNIEDLIDARDIAELVGVVSEIQVYKFLDQHPKFPRPIIDRGGRNRAMLWSKKQVVKWSETTDEPVKKCYIYYARCRNYVKIGTSKDPYARVHYLRNDPYSGLDDKESQKDLELVGYTIGTFKMERALHKMFDEYRVSEHSREWFFDVPEIRKHMMGLIAKNPNPLYNL